MFSCHSNMLLDEEWMKVAFEIGNDYDFLLLLRVAFGRRYIDSLPLGDANLWNPKECFESGLFL